MLFGQAVNEAVNRNSRMSGLGWLSNKNSLVLALNRAGYETKRVDVPRLFRTLYLPVLVLMADSSLSWNGAR